MAITNAQQYQQLVNKPANGKRPGYRGDAAYGSRSRSNQATSSRAATSTSNVSPGAGNSRRGNEGPDDRSSARQTYNTAIATGRNPKGIDLDKGPPPLTEKEKQFVKDNPPKSTLADFFDRRKQAYNFARSLPGAKKSSFANLNAYRDYLVSQGADLSTIDRLMEGVDEEFIEGPPCLAHLSKIMKDPKFDGKDRFMYNYHVFVKMKYPDDWVVSSIFTPISFWKSIIW